MKLNLYTIKKHITPLVWLLASMLLFFPVSMHALPGIVLCVENDGRIEIENGRSGDCARKVFKMAQEVHTELVSLEADGFPGIECQTSCFDILLFASPADGQAASTLKDASQTTSDLYPAATLQHVPNLDAWTPILLASEPAVPQSPLTLLRTVVLLI